MVTSFQKKIKKQGFTLIELIIVIAIIGIIAAIVFVALDPATRFADERNARRWQATNSILDAVKLYQIDNDGELPSGISTNLQMIGTADSSCDIECDTTPTDSSSSTFTDDDVTDFSGLFNNTQWNAGNSWVELTDSSVNPNGSYVSTIKNAGASIPWNSLAWTPQQPFYKELPDSGISESDYPSGNANMFGNVLLMHLNESSGQIVDTSGNGNNGTYNGALYSQDGLLNTALGFNGTDDRIQVNNDPTINPSTSITVSFWAKPQNISNFGRKMMISKNGFTYLGWDIFHEYFHDGSNWVRKVRVNINGDIMDSGVEISQNVWQHFAFTYDGSDIRIYQDGQETASFNNPTYDLSSVENLRIGSFAGGGNHFDGIIDEVGIWSRPLTGPEIQDIYRRGANRLKFQVRSCDNAACSGESFIGPDGTGSTYYSELNNATANPPGFNLTNVNNNQYFQYQVGFESDSSSLSPELLSTNITGTGGGGGGEVTTSACLDLSTDLSNYLPTIPQDPKDGSIEKTYYAIKQTGAQGGITIISCNAELGEYISSSK